LQHPAEIREALLRQRAQQLILVVEVEIDRPRRVANRFSDLAQRKVLIAVLEEHLPGGLKDGLIEFFFLLLAPLLRAFA